MRYLLVLGFVVLALLGGGAPAAAQSYSCQQDYFGYVTCSSGYRTATCGSIGFWGEVRCTDSRGAFTFDWPGAGYQNRGTPSSIYDSLLQPSVPYRREPSIYCSLLAAC